MQVLHYIEECRLRIDEVLEYHLPAFSNAPETLHDAMRYACLSGGKRIRPLLVYATGRTLDIKREKLDVAAAAVEFIHAYSLIHDDLPAMDNDELRRGKPTCHIAFDQATAILAGDALQTLAFEIIANAENIKPESRIKMISCLAKGAGSFGMVGGQAIDISAQNDLIDAEQLTHMHRCKTGALIRASVQMAALVEPVAKDTFNQLTLFAECLGLAFQVQDDILDVVGDTSIMGKKQGKDQRNNKTTYPSMLGLTGAQQWLHQLQQEALGLLSQIDGDTDYLKHITNFIVARDK